MAGPLQEEEHMRMDALRFLIAPVVALVALIVLPECVGGS
jgi:hypothetical protein